MPDGKPLDSTPYVPESVVRSSKNAQAFKGSYEAQQNLGKVSPLEKDLSSVINKEAEKNWFARGFANVKDELNPFAKDNFIQGSKNIMSVVGALTPADDYYDDYAQPKAGVQDFHTGYAGYTPPQDFNMFNQQGGGSFGFPALQEQLNNYNMFSSQGDFMLNSQTNLRS